MYSITHASYVCNRLGRHRLCMTVVAEFRSSACARLHLHSISPKYAPVGIFIRILRVRLRYMTPFWLVDVQHWFRTQLEMPAVLAGPHYRMCSIKFSTQVYASIYHGEHAAQRRAEHCAYAFQSASARVRTIIILLSAIGVQIINSVCYTRIYILCTTLHNAFALDAALTSDGGRLNGLMCNVFVIQIVEVNSSLSACLYISWHGNQSSFYFNVLRIFL